MAGLVGDRSLRMGIMGTQRQVVRVVGELKTFAITSCPGCWMWVNIYSCVSGTQKTSNKWNSIDAPGPGLSLCLSIKNANGQQCQLHSFIVGGTSGTASVAGTAFKVVVVVDRRTRTMHTLYTPGPEVQLMIEEAPFVDVIVTLFFTNQRYLPIETQSGKGAAKRRRQHRPLNGIDLILLLPHL